MTAFGPEGEINGRPLLCQLTAGKPTPFAQDEFCRSRPQANLIANVSSAVSSLVDQFVSNCAQPLRYGEAERPRSVEVDDKLELGWLLNWQV
jgi:hypothetical protein